MKKETVNALQVGSIKIISIRNNPNMDGDYWQIYPKHEDRLLVECYNSSILMNALYSIAEHNPSRFYE